MPRAGLTMAAVVDAAIDVVDAHGADGLTLAAVAARTGVATPSLYKHVDNLAQLKALVAVRVMDEMTEHLTAAVLGHSRDDAVAALMRAFRTYVNAHPARYAAMTADPLHNPALAAAGNRLLNVFLAALRGYDLDDAGAIHATRCLRATIHGFASLEAAGGFGLPQNLEDTYERLIRMFIASLHTD